MGLNADDYVSLTSFTHHPFYSKFALESKTTGVGLSPITSPSMNSCAPMEYAIDKGYTIAWALT